MRDLVLEKAISILEKFFPLKGENSYFGVDNSNYYPNSQHHQKPLYWIDAKGNFAVTWMLDLFKRDPETGEKKARKIIVQDCICLTANQLEYSQERLEAFFESYTGLVRHIIEWEGKHQELYLITHSLMNSKVINALDLKKARTKEDFELALTSKIRLGEYLMKIQSFEESLGNRFKF